MRDGLAKRPVDGFGPAEFDRTVYRALGRTERWAGLADGLRTYLRDGTTGPLRPAEPFDGAASRTYEAANRTVKCADGPAPTSSRVMADIRRMRRLDPQPLLTGMEASVCAYWHHRPAHRTPLGSPEAPPVLLIASAHDPVTPIEGARALQRRLPGSRLVSLAPRLLTRGVRQPGQRRAWTVRPRRTWSTGPCPLPMCTARGPDCPRPEHR